jgi:hypothetical protein
MNLKMRKMHKSLMLKPCIFPVHGKGATDEQVGVPALESKTDALDSSEPHPAQSNLIKPNQAPAQSPCVYPLPQRAPSAGEGSAPSPLRGEEVGVPALETKTDALDSSEPHPAPSNLIKPDPTPASPATQPDRVTSVLSNAPMPNNPLSPGIVGSLAEID